MNEQLSQVQRVERQLPESAEDDLTKPRMPFESNLVLTREQEDELMKHALEYLDKLEGQLQRKTDENGGSSDRVKGCDPESFFGKRELYTKRYYNHVKDRAQKDTLYEHSNLTASLSQRITCQMVAKSVKFFFGEPDDIDWFTAEGIGIEDEAQAEKIKHHSRWKFKQCGIKPSLSQALEFAFVRGEAVVKVTHQTRGQIYKRKAVILVDAAGQPIFDAHGDYIIQGDAVDEQMELQEAPPEPVPADGMAPEVAAPISEPVPVPTGKMILRKDGVTEMPAEPIWKQEVITRRLITFQGPEAKLVYYKDFLCSEGAEDIQTTDFIAQLFDGNAMHFAEMITEAQGDSGVADMQAAIERLRAMIHSPSDPQAESGKARADFSETDTSRLNSPVNQWAECYLTYSPFGDGTQYQIQLILDRTAKAPIFYEYTANVTTTGLRPYRVIRNKAVDGRWYGMGSMEFFAPEQEFIDLQINRKNFGDSAAGRVTAFHPWMCVEGQRDPNLSMHTGQTYTMRDGYKLEDMVQTVYLQPDTAEFMELLELFMQLMQLKSGVINAGDQQMSGLPSSQLATGINEVRDSGEELFSSVIATLFPGVNDVLTAAVEVTYANHNEKELFQYFNGEANEILSLTPEDVRDLALNVSLVLSRTQERRTLEMADRVDNVVDRYYGRMPIIQQRTANMARKQLKALRVSQADKVIEPMPDLGMVGPDGQPLPANVEQMPATSMI